MDPRHALDIELLSHGIHVGPPHEEVDPEGLVRQYHPHQAPTRSIYNHLAPIAADPNGPIEELYYDPSGHGWRNGQDIGPLSPHTPGSAVVHVKLKGGTPSLPPPGEIHPDLKANLDHNARAAKLLAAGKDVAKELGAPEWQAAKT